MYTLNHYNHEWASENECGVEAERDRNTGEYTFTGTINIKKPPPWKIHE